MLFVKNDFRSTTPKKQIIILDNKEANVNFSIRLEIGRKDDDSPIISNSTLILQLERARKIAYYVNQNTPGCPGHKGSALDYSPPGPEYSGCAYTP